MFFFPISLLKDYPNKDTRNIYRLLESLGRRRVHTMATA